MRHDKRELIARIRRLERELLDKPTIGQVEAVMEHNRRLETLYEAVLKRNQVLVRKLKGEID